MALWRPSSSCLELLPDGGARLSVRGIEVAPPALVVVRGNVAVESRLRTLVEHFEYVGARCVNRLCAAYAASDKFSSMMRLARGGVAVPASWLPELEPSRVCSLLELGSFGRIVIKRRFGTHGRGVLLADGRMSLLSMVEHLACEGVPFFVQDYVPSRGGEWRVLVAGGEVLGVVRRIPAADDFRANHHRGARSVADVPPEGVESLAVEAARVLGLDVAGVDVIVGPAGPVVLEVNPSPGFEGMERVLGPRLAEGLVRCYMDLLTRRVSPTAISSARGGAGSRSS